MVEEPLKSSSDRLLRSMIEETLRGYRSEPAQFFKALAIQIEELEPDLLTRERPSISCLLAGIANGSLTSDQRGVLADLVSLIRDCDYDSDRSSQSYYFSVRVALDCLRQRADSTRPSLPTLPLDF